MEGGVTPPQCYNQIKKLSAYSVKYVRGWQFLKIEAAETLCIVCVPPEEINIWVINLSKSPIL